jgi:hypothetical protein
VRLARKGWLTRNDVVNTMTREEIEELFQLDPIS